MQCPGRVLDHHELSYIQRPLMNALWFITIMESSFDATLDAMILVTSLVKL